MFSYYSCVVKNITKNRRDKFKYFFQNPQKTKIGGFTKMKDELKFLAKKWEEADDDDDDWNDDDKDDKDDEEDED
jgi:hypothetical protein